MQQPTNFDSGSDWLRDRPRTLIAKDGAVWIWPGIPLAMEQDGSVQTLPNGWVRFWVAALHGFEAQHKPLVTALDRAARYLAEGNEPVAGDLGIAPLVMPIGTKSLPWGAGDHVQQRALFRRFGNAASAFEKAGNPDQPRWPKYAPDSQGGRYAPGNAGAGSPDSATGRGQSDRPPVGIGDNKGPAFDDMPEIPEDEPPAELRKLIIKNIAQWLIRRAVVALIPGVGEAAAIVQAGIWLYEYLPDLDAYIQPPQTLEELQDAANTSKPGYQIHHIVEQGPARGEGYSKDDIEAPEILVRISTLRHRQISGWYSTPTDAESEFHGLSPREYLHGKDWAEKLRVGREALVRFGVLKP